MWRAVVILAWSSAAFADGPGDAALAFLRGLGSVPGAVAIEKTASSQDLTRARRGEIADQLDDLGRQIQAPDLRILAETEDGDLAAVLVSQITEFNAATAQVHAVGLVKNGGEWRPSPLPASFDSTGLSLRPGYPERVRRLEEWMVNGRSEQLIHLKDNVFQLLDQEIRKAKSPEALRQETPEIIAEEFIAALRSRNLPLMLALAGGLESPPPREWQEILGTLTTVGGSRPIQHPQWRLLTGLGTLTAVVHVETEGDVRQVGVALLGPTASGRLRPQLIQLPFVRSGSGLWRLELPRSLWIGAGSEAGSADGIEVDTDLLALFPRKLATLHPPAPSPTAREAAEQLLAALGKGSMTAVCANLDLSAEPLTALDALSRASKLWQSLREPGDVLAPVLLDLHEVGDDAVAVVQLLSAKFPERARLETLCFRRGAAGWLASPAFSGPAALALAQDPGPIDAWARDAIHARRDHWSAGLLTQIGEVPADSAPAIEDARRTVEAWRGAIASGDASIMLAHSAGFSDESGTRKLLANTGYELLTRGQGEILSVHRNGRWAAVSVRVPPLPGENSAASYAFHVVVATPAGPRVMPELDFFDPLTRSRGFLNQRLWERVDDRLPGAARGELEAIFETHLSLSAADRERRQKPTE